MARKAVRPRQKIYSAISETAERYHFSPLSEGPNGKQMHQNLVLMTLTYFLDKNHLLIGEPGWGKTTSAKILAAKLSGVPYDLYDALEIRGNPQKYEEKIVGRPNYGKLSQGMEEVVWQGTFGLPVLVVDEGNRLPYDSQDVILQGIDTGRWNYQNRSLYEGKKPTFITINERPDHHQNGFIAALKDRLDMVTEEAYWTTMILFDLKDAKKRVGRDLCMHEYTETALAALAQDYAAFQKAIKGRPIKGHLVADEKRLIQEEIESLEPDNDAMLFMQAFMAEINYSAQYGCKRGSDPISTDTHDQNYAGVHVRHSFSPRSGLAMEYAKALAWFLGDNEVMLDHVRFVLPHVFAHKAEFTDDYKDKHGNDPRKDNEMIHLAKCLVGEVFARYTQAIQPIKNFISELQKGKAGSEELAGLKEQEFDHPLMKDLIREAKEGEKKAFYEE